MSKSVLELVDAVFKRLKVRGSYGIRVHFLLLSVFLDVPCAYPKNNAPE